MEPAPELVSDEPFGRDQSLQRRLFLILVAEHAYAHSRLPQIWRHADPGDADEADTRVLQVAPDDRHDLLTHLLADLVGAVAGHRDLRNEHQCSLNFFPLEPISLHRVARGERLESLDPDAALLPRGHLPHIFLEMLQRADPAFVDKLPCTEQFDPATAGDLAFEHAAAGDDSEAGDLDRGDDLDAALADLPVSGLAQALRRPLHILCQLVDDVVVADLDLCLLRRRLRCRGGLEVEAHDDRVRDAGEQQVRVADLPDALADDLDRHHRILDFLQRRKQRLERALGVSLDDEAELLDLAFFGAAGQLFERDARRDVARGLLRATLQELGQCDLARCLLGADHLEDVAGLRHLAHAGHDHRRGGWGFVDAAPAVVGQSAHAAVDVAADEVVADLESARLHQHCGDRAPTSLEVGVDDRADRVAVRVRLQLEDVRGKDDGGQQVLDALAGARADVHAFELATVVACDDSLLGELLVDAID